MLHFRGKKGGVGTLFFGGIFWGKKHDFWDFFALREAKRDVPHSEIVKKSRKKGGPKNTKKVKNGG
jgi:hypothetical protein